MRGAQRWSSALVLLLACAPASSPTQPPTPTAFTVPPVQEPAVSPRPWWELRGTSEVAELIGHGAHEDPDHEPAYRVTIDAPTAVAGAPDGGAFVLQLETRETDAGRESERYVMRLGPDGRERWRATIPEGSWQWEVLPFAGGVVAKPAGGREMHVISATGDLLASPEVQIGSEEGGSLELAAHGDVLVAAHAHGVVRLSGDGEKLWQRAIRLFPDAETSEGGGPYNRRYVAVGADGTVLTGGEDGSLVALTSAGEHRFQLGVRGPIERIAARHDGGFSVFTDRNHHVVDVTGRVHAESYDSAALLHRFVDRRERPHYARAPLLMRSDAPATNTYVAEAAKVADEPLRNVRSLVVLAPDDIWALGSAGVTPGEDDDDRELFHYDGRTWTPQARPKLALAAAAGEVEILPGILARGPGGVVLIGASLADGGARLVVLERSDGSWRERRDLTAAFADVNVWGNVTHTATYAAGADGREVVCFGAGGEATCFGKGRGAAVEALATGAGKSMGRGFAMVQGEHSHLLAPHLFAGANLWRLNGSARGADDVWGTDGQSIGHWDGQTTTKMPFPYGVVSSLWADADGLWIAGAAGLVRYDGRRFLRVMGIERAWSQQQPFELHVTGAGSEVWAYGAMGAWRVRPSPAPADVIAEPPAPPALARASAVVTLGRSSYHLERVTITVTDREPLHAAISVAASDGVIWFYDGVRLVELSGDGSDARELYRAPEPEPFVCWSIFVPDCGTCADCTERRPFPLACARCAAPQSAGSGVLLSERGLLRLRGGVVDRRLARSVSAGSAVRASSAGFWVSSGRDDDGLPHALVVDDALKLVRGLPALAYADVDLAGDDVWLAGAQTTSGEHGGPVGEGALVYFDGRRTRQYRAPEGPLLAVAGVGGGEAWAVGVAGGIVRVRDDAAVSLRLPTSSSVTLRAAAARDSNDVWLAGDGATLLHHDGALGAVDTSAAGERAPFSAVVPPQGDRPGWVVGPSGIWRIVRD